MALTTFHHPPRGRARRGVSSPQRGVTLIELLVVLGLMSVLMGLGVSMYTNLGKQSVFSASVTRVMSAINRVRNSSQTHPAILQIVAGDPNKSEFSAVRGMEFVTFFESQCERPLEGDDAELIRGALGRDGRLPAGGAKFVSGMIGEALFLEGGGSVDCGNHPAYDATEGIFLDVAVYALSNRGGTLVVRGEGLELSLERRGEGVVPRLQLGFSSGDGSSAVRETVVFEAKDAVVPLGKWVRIVGSYDRSNVVLSVDQGRGPVEKLRQRETRPLAPSTEDRLYVGGGGGKGASFHGYIDDIRIQGVLGEGGENFPPAIGIDGKTRRIWFLGGKLDPSHHQRPETIVIVSGKKRREIVIGTEGNIIDK